MRPMPKYGDKPTLVVGITEDGVAGVHAEGFDLPADVRVVERDYTRGNDEDEHGDLYVDTEV